MVLDILDIPNFGGLFSQNKKMPDITVKMDLTAFIQEIAF